MRRLTAGAAGRPSRAKRDEVGKVRIQVSSITSPANIVRSLTVGPATVSDVFRLVEQLIQDTEGAKI